MKIHRECTIFFGIRMLTRNTNRVNDATQRLNWTVFLKDAQISFGNQWRVADLHVPKTNKEHCSFIFTHQRFRIAGVEAEAEGPDAGDRIIRV